MSKFKPVNHATKIFYPLTRQHKAFYISEETEEQLERYYNKTDKIQGKRTANYRNEDQTVRDQRARELYLKTKLDKLKTKMYNLRESDRLEYMKANEINLS
jgi:hypothetical protein